MGHKAIWKVYQEELHKRGQGLPLWVPEPMDGNEVHIGDVGTIYEGGFRPIFNAITGKTYYNWNLPGGDQFEHLEIPLQLQSTVKRWLQAGEHVVSAGVTVKKGGAEAQATELGRISLSLETTKDKAAFVVVRADATRETVLPNRRMAEYMTKNIQSWVDLVASVSLEFKQDDFILIRGHVKTSAWGVGATSTSSSHSEITVSGGYGPALAKFSFSVDATHKTGLQQRRWPEDSKQSDPLPASHPPGEHNDQPDLPSNQSLFLSYYKMKRRFWRPNEIYAGAGPHALPDDRSDSPTIDQGGLQVDPDPVNQLLDWILKQTEDKGVDDAIACHGDLVELFRDREWPEDIPAFLDGLMPELTIEGKVAMISQEHAIYRAHFPPEEEVGEAYAPAYPEGIPDDNNGKDPSGTDPEEADEGPSETHDQPTAAVVEPDTGEGAEGGEGSKGGEGDEDGDPDDEGPPPSPRPVVKRRPMNSTSVIGKCVMGDRTMEWPHRQLLDRDETSESAAIASFHVSLDGEYVGVGYEDGQVRIWNDEKWQLVVRIEGEHEGSVSALKFSPDGTRVVSADSVAIVWDIEDSKHGHYHEISRLEGQADNDMIWDIAWSPDGETIATGASDATIKLYDAKTGHLTRTLDELPTLVSRVEFSKDGQYLVGITDAIGYIWRCSTFHRVGKMEGHTANIWAMSFSHDCKRIVTGSEDNTSRIWNTENGEELVTLREHTGPVWAVGFSPDGKNVMSGSYDATISICDSFLGDRIHLLQGGQSVISSAAYSPGGHYITSGSADGTIKLWDTTNGNLLCELSGHEDHIKTSCFSPKGNAIISSSDDGTVRVWSLTDILRVA